MRQTPNERVFFEEEKKTRREKNGRGEGKKTGESGDRIRMNTWRVGEHTREHTGEIGIMTGRGKNPALPYSDKKRSTENYGDTS